MTIYVFNIMKVSSLGKLPTAIDVLELCLYLGQNILKILLGILSDSDHQNRDTIARHMSMLWQYIKSMMRVVPTCEPMSHPVSIRYVSIQQNLHGHVTNEVYSVSNLRNVHPLILIDLLSHLLENGVICARSYTHRLPQAIPTVVFDNCINIIGTITSELLIIFVKPRSPIQFQIISSLIRLEFCDQQEVVHYLI
jgi:hypothetical protein